MFVLPCCGLTLRRLRGAATHVYRGPLTVAAFDGNRFSVERHGPGSEHVLEKEDARVALSIEVPRLDRIGVAIHVVRNEADWMRSTLQVRGDAGSGGAILRVRVSLERLRRRG